VLCCSPIEGKFPASPSILFNGNPWSCNDFLTAQDGMFYKFNAPTKDDVY